MQSPTQHTDVSFSWIREVPALAVSAIQAVYTALWTMLCISAALLVRLVTGRQDIPLRMAAWLWSPGLIGLSGGWTVEGRERVDWSRPCLVVANHASVLDICAIYVAVPIPLRFLLKQEMTRVPFIGWYGRAMGMIFMQRESRRAGIEMLRDAAAMLRGGKSLCIFPEGTRTRTGAVAPFKSGTFQAAIDAGADVVPIALVNTGDVFPPEGFFRIRRAKIHIRIGDPIATAGAGAPDRQAVADQARAAVLAMLQRPQQG